MIAERKRLSGCSDCGNGLGGHHVLVIYDFNDGIRHARDNQQACKDEYFDVIGKESAEAKRRAQPKQLDQKVSGKGRFPVFFLAEL